MGSNAIHFGFKYYDNVINVGSFVFNLTTLKKDASDCWLEKHD